MKLPDTALADTRKLVTLTLAHREICQRIKAETQPTQREFLATLLIEIDRRAAALLEEGK